MKNTPHILNWKWRASQGVYTMHGLCWLRKEKLISANQIVHNTISSAWICGMSSAPNMLCVNLIWTINSYILFIFIDL